MEETDIKEGLRRRCNNSYEYVFKKYYSGLCSYTTSILKDEYCAEDIVQELFASIWLRADKNNVRGSLKNYLYTAARNRCFDFLKHQKVHSKYMERIVHNEKYYTLESWMISEEILKTFNRTLKNFPPRCKEVFIRSRIDGLKNQEIASELGLSIRTVEHHISSGLIELRNNLRPYLNID